MSRISKYLSDDEIKAIQQKGSKFIEKFEKQQSGKLYRDANFLYNRTQLKQMEKAADKYENVLGDNDGWTAEDLVTHAFEELVDQSHYLTRLLTEIKKIRNEKAELKKQADFWRNKFRASRYLSEEWKDDKGKGWLK